MTYRYFLGIDDFPARWHCGRWTDLLGWTHVTSDILIWAAYFAIPIVLLYFAGKREDLPFSYIFPVFGAFILACGTGHLIDAVIFWYPIYRVSAIVKAFTALISWAAVVVLFDLIPKLLAYPSPEQLRREIEMRAAVQADLEKKSRQLEMSNNALEAFTYTASHDLKTPLRGIRNLVDFLIEDSGGSIDDAANLRLGKIKGQAERMEGLLNGLLEYATSDFSTDHQVVVDTSLLVSEIADLTPRPEGIRIVALPSLPKIHSRVAPLATVLRNLIANAVFHHHATEGLIEVGAENQGNFICFWVRDDGPGIDQAQHERIFEVFRKLSKSGSSGVGLAIVKKTVHEVGGTVEVRSAEGAGAEFRFTWPKDDLVS